MDKKYRLLENDTFRFKDDNGIVRKLYRIEALQEIREDVTVGTKGGYVECERNLSQTGSCWIYDDAKVYDMAKILDDAIVYDNARVYDYAICDGISQVFEDSTVSGYASVRNDARVFGRAIVCNYAIIEGHARVYDDVTIAGGTITDITQIYGEAMIKNGYICKDAKVSGSVIIDGDVSIGEDGFVSKQNDFISISGIGIGCETLTAYRTKDNRTNIVYSGGFIGNIGEFTKYISDETIFGTYTTSELKLIIQMILKHMATDFTQDLEQIESNDDEYGMPDEPEFLEDEDIDDDEDFFESLANGLVMEDEESPATYDE